MLNRKINLCGLVAGLMVYVAIAVFCAFAVYGFAKFVGWA